MQEKYQVTSQETTRANYEGTKKGTMLNKEQGTM